MKKVFSLALVLMVLCMAVTALPAYAGESEHPWTIYFHPGVRFGTDNRTLYIMDFLVPLYQGDKNILFFNPRFTPNDQNGWEANFGFGYRHLLFNDKLILGGNFYYDYRETGWGTSHEQIGFGFEAMTEVNKNLALTARFNYYIPMSDAIVADGITGTPLGYNLREDGIYQLWDNATLTRTVEEPLEGFDGEIGIRVPFVSDYVETWVYGGGYHYWGNYIGKVNGWTARLELVPTDFVRLNYEYRYDNISHGEHYGEVMFEIPFSVENLYAGKNPFAGIGKRLSGSRELNERLVEPVRRDVDVVLKNKSIRDYVGDRFDYLRERVVYVSDTGSDETGNGTFSNPYRTIQMGVDNLGSATTIHVMHRIDGTNEFAGMGVLGHPGLTIWGSGVTNPKYPTIDNFSPTDAPMILNDAFYIGACPRATVAGFWFLGTGAADLGGVSGGAPAPWGMTAIVIDGSSNGVVIRDNNFTLTGDGGNAHRLSGIFVAHGGINPGETPILIVDNVFSIRNTYDSASLLAPSEAYGIAMYIPWVGYNGQRNVMGRIEGNEFHISCDDPLSFSFAVTARGDRDSDSIPNAGSVGTSSQPFYCYGNLAEVSNSAIRGLIWAQPGSSGGSIDTYAVMSNIRVGYGFGNIVIGASGCNYDVYYDQLRNPSMYIHPGTP